MALHGIQITEEVVYIADDRPTLLGEMSTNKFLGIYYNAQDYPDFDLMALQPPLPLYTSPSLDSPPNYSLVPPYEPPPYYAMEGF